MNQNNINKTNDATKEKDYNKKIIYKSITQDDINSINKDSSISLLNALYQCEDYILFDENGEAIVNKKSFNYISPFYLSFLFNKENLTDKYLEARKALYESVNLLKNDKSFSFNNSRILQSQDKSIQIIFLDTSYSLSNLIHIHNNKINIFTKDKTYLDIQSLLQDYKDYGITQDSFNSPNTQIFFYSHLLTGSPETESNPLFFGELDKDNIIKQDTPAYQFSPKDEEYNLGTLRIFFNSYTLTLLNYSLLDSSLNIKLELTNKESKDLRDKAIIQRKQKQKQEQTKTTTSTAMLCPILEDDNLKCSHGGIVKLQSSVGKNFKSKEKSMILESDLLNSQIQGCSNPPMNGGPCNLVSVILPSARALKKYNDDYPIMQDLVSAGVLSDKGLPIICTPKANTFKINSPAPTNAENSAKEGLLSQIKPTKPSLRLHYKIIPKQKDNLPIYKVKINEELLESNNKEALDKIEIDLKTQTKDLSNKELESILQESYTKDYEFKELTLHLDTTLASLIFLIPLKIPKVYKNALKDYEYKEYGIGRYQYIYKYCFCEDLQDFKSSSTSKSDAHNDTLPSPLTHYNFVLHAPYQAQKLDLCIAQGIDSIIYQEDRQEEETLNAPLYKLKMIICNGGHRENVWGGVERI